MARQLPMHPDGVFSLLPRDDDAHHAGRIRPFAASHGHGAGGFSPSTTTECLTLLNNAETRACVFLLTDSADVPNAEGLCSVYEIRPEGMPVPYPYVLDTNDEAVLDQGLPTSRSVPPSARGHGVHPAQS